MTRRQALLLAPADPLGIRWAQAEFDDRTYLACLWPDGTELAEVRPRENWRKATRLVRDPKRVSWRPVREPAQ